MDTYIYIYAPTVVEYIQTVTWTGEELGANFDVTPLAESSVSDELKEKAQKYHEDLVELAVEQDEDVLMAYLDVSVDWAVFMLAHDTKGKDVWSPRMRGEENKSRASGHDTFFVG